MADVRLADGDVAATLEDRLLHLAEALVMLISQGQASVQLKMVRQRHTIVRQL